MISGSQARTVRDIGPRFRSGKLLIFRFTPLGLICPRLDTHRSSRISSMSASI